MEPLGNKRPRPETYLGLGQETIPSRIWDYCRCGRTDSSDREGTELEGVFTVVGKRKILAGSPIKLAVGTWGLIVFWRRRVVVAGDW